MDHRGRTVLACAGIVGIFLLVQLGTLALIEPFQQEGHQVVEDTGDPTLSVAFVGALLVVTALMIAAIKYGGDALIRAVILFSAVYISFFVFQVLFPPVAAVTVGGTAVDVLAVAAAVALGLALSLYPEWYVVDAAGVVMGVGAAGLFGVNFGLLPALVLLSVLAVYDAISVYGTEHMLTLASGVMDLRLPVVLVVPLSLSYSFLDADTPDPAADDTDGTDDATGPEGSSQGTPDPSETDAAGSGDRDALFIGLGDAVIPTVLVASAAFFAGGPAVSLLGVPATLPAVTAMAGTLLGLVVLLWLVLKGRAHAGLPLLNGGAIGGYLVGALAGGLTLAEALGVGGLL